MRIVVEIRSSCSWIECSFNLKTIDMSEFKFLLVKDSMAVMGEGSAVLSVLSVLEVRG